MHVTRGSLDREEFSEIIYVVSDKIIIRLSGYGIIGNNMIIKQQYNISDNIFTENGEIYFFK